MANTLWYASGLNVAQVNTYTFGGTWESSDVINITIGQKTASTTATSTTIATIVTALKSFFNNLDEDLYPEFAKITAEDNTADFVLTADDEGVPFTCTISTTETGGGAADAQTIDGGTSSTGVATTANSGDRNWDTAKNWSTGAAPADTNDLYIDIAEGPILYGISAADTELASFNLSAKFRDDIGLPVVNEDGYYEYRDTYLRVDATTVNIGYAEGPGSRRIKLDLGATDASTVNVYKTGTPVEDGVPAFLLKGAHASNLLNIISGSVGVGFFPGETANFPTIRVGNDGNPATDASLFLGAGVSTITTLHQFGGAIISNAPVTTWNLRDDATATMYAGAIGTLNVYSGVVQYKSTATITALVIHPGAVVDFSRDPRARACAAITMYKGATLLDPHVTISGTPALTLVDCDWDEVTIKAGRGKIWTRN